MSSLNFPWDALPRELRAKVLSRLPLSLVHQLQPVFPRDAPPEFSRRVAALRPLWLAWLDSPIAVRNVPAYRTRPARQACPPLAFVCLERLVLGASNMYTLSPAIAELGHSLKVLHLDDNHLVDLPDELCQCEGVLLIDCSQNLFDRVPECVMRLRRLKYLFFAQNFVTEVPRGVVRLPALYALSFYRCLLTKLPMELVDKAVQTHDFSLNVAENRFPRRYLISIVDVYPAFKRRLTHVMVE